MLSSPTNISSSSFATTSSFQSTDSSAVNSSTVFFPQMTNVASTSEVLASVIAQINETVPAISEDLLRGLTTTRSMSLKENELPPKTVQEGQFTSILQAAFSPDLWLVSSFKLRNLTPQQSVEVYNHSRLLQSSLNARASWLRVKTEIATLLPLNEANPNDTKEIKNIWRKLKKNLNKLIKYALEHQAYLQKRQDGKMSEEPIEVNINNLKDKNEKFVAYRRNARKNLTAAEKAYSTVLEKCFLEDAEILERLPEYLHHRNAIGTIIKKFPALDIETVNQIIDKASKTATNQSILDLNHMEETTFKVTRLIASETFWQSLTAEELTETEFNKKFCKFLMTSWISDTDIKLANVNEIAKAKKNNERALACKLRNSWQFRENLHKRAFGIIHNILIFIRNKAKYDAANKDNTRTLNIFQKQLQLSTKKINQHYNDAFQKDYKSYVVRRSKNWEGAALEEQIKELDKESLEYLLVMKKSKKQDNQDIMENLQLINSVLTELKASGFITEENIEALISERNQELFSPQASTSNQPENTENSKFDLEDIFSASSSEYELLISPDVFPLAQPQEITKGGKRISDFFDTDQPQAKKATTEETDLSQKQTINQENLIKFSALSMPANLFQLITTRPLFELPAQDSISPSQFLTDKDLDISESLPDDLFSNEQN